MSEDAERETERRTSEAAIHRELLAARRRMGGLSPRQMANSPVIADLLGNGDPEVAHVELGHKLLEIIETDDDVMAIEAACYSLGYASEKDTHLGRLEEFGAKHLLDQRQARRYSDRGIEQLARLISTHWTAQTVPEATVIIVGVPPGQIGFFVRVRCQRHIDMRHPKLSLWPANEDRPSSIEVEWRRISDETALWVEHETIPQVVNATGETTLRLVWRGETWPKFSVILTGSLAAYRVTSETLGAACAVTMQTTSQPTGIVSGR